MPREGLLARPLRNATLDGILREKARWKVAAMALTYRMNELGFVTEWEYRNHCIELSRRGFRRSEPDGIAQESSLLLAKVLRSLRDKRSGLSDIATDLGITMHELTQHLLELVVMPVPGLIDIASGPNDRPAGPQRHLRLA
jgi:Zn-dependent peptidase ImmA (M78 family)